MVGRSLQLGQTGTGVAITANTGEGGAWTTLRATGPFLSVQNRQLKD